MKNSKAWVVSKRRTKLALTEGESAFLPVIPRARRRWYSLLDMSSGCKQRVPVVL